MCCATFDLGVLPAGAQGGGCTEKRPQARWAGPARLAGLRSRTPAKSSAGGQKPDPVLAKGGGVPLGQRKILAEFHNSGGNAGGTAGAVRRGSATRRLLGEAGFSEPWGRAALLHFHDMAPELVVAQHATGNHDPEVLSCRDA